MSKTQYVSPNAEVHILRVVSIICSSPLSPGSADAGEFGYDDEYEEMD
ncbi:MAG: hypothetical protein MJY55_00625 [Bacteroidales bacterium]|nr:hypothetical protein [Bacteroidales bacterium]